MLVGRWRLAIVLLTPGSGLFGSDFSIPLDFVQMVPLCKVDSSPIIETSGSDTYLLGAPQLLVVFMNQLISLSIYCFQNIRYDRGVIANIALAKSRGAYLQNLPGVTIGITDAQLTLDQMQNMSGPESIQTEWWSRSSSEKNRFPMMGKKSDFCPSKFPVEVKASASWTHRTKKAAINNSSFNFFPEVSSFFR